VRDTRSHPDVDGRVMDVLYNASVYKDDRAKCSACSPPHVTSTERKRIEQALRETNVNNGDREVGAEKSQLRQIGFLRA